MNEKRELSRKRRRIIVGVDWEKAWKDKNRKIVVTNEAAHRKREKRERGKGKGKVKGRRTSEWPVLGNRIRTVY